MKPAAQRCPALSSNWHATPTSRSAYSKKLTPCWHKAKASSMKSLSASWRIWSNASWKQSAFTVQSSICRNWTWRMSISHRNTKTQPHRWMWKKAQTWWFPSTHCTSKWRKMKFSSEVNFWSAVTRTTSPNQTNTILTDGHQKIANPSQNT